MLSAPISPAPVLTQEWLVSRTFTFRSETSGVVIGEAFVFNRNGLIVGHAHANEKFWEIDGEIVRIIDRNGKTTCVMKPRISDQGKIELAGVFCNPAADYAATGIVHILEENDSDYHARIQSFDLFDTLVARHCYDPLSVFKNVEAKSGVVGFAARRHAVEMSMFGRKTYGLDDIY